MALQAFLDSFAVSTGAASTTQARTGYGFQPKALIMFGSRSDEATDAVFAFNNNFHFGFAASATSRACISATDTDASAAVDSSSAVRTDAIDVQSNSSGGVTALLDVNSIDSDGWTAIVDDNYAVATRKHVLALGGADITNVAIGNFAAATSGATQDITGVGFQPDALILIGISNTASGNATQTQSKLCIGIVGGTNAADNACLALSVTDAANPSVTRSYCRNGESLVGLSSTSTLDGRGYVSAFGSDGFTVTWNANPSAAYRFHFLAIKGGRFSVGDVLTQTDTTTDITETGLAFSPVAGFLLSACKAASSAGTLDAGWESSVGAFTSASSEKASATRDADNVTPTQTSYGIEYDACYLNISSSDTLDGTMHITAVNSDGYTARMADADPAQAFVAHLLFGSAAGGSKVPVIQNHRLRH